MSLSLLRRAEHPPFLRFHNVDFKVIDHNGQPWLLPEQIGEALGIAQPRRNTLQLYYRHQDEFGPDEVAEIEMEVEHGGVDSRLQSEDASRPKLTLHTRRVKVKIFSLRGAYHLGFFARTDLAKQFRQWVLDLIEGKGHDRNFQAPYYRVWRYECDKHPRWPEVYRLLKVGEPTVRIAQAVQCAPSTVRRDVSEMGRASFITAEELAQFRDYQRTYARALKEVRASRQLPLAF